MSRPIPYQPWQVLTLTILAMIAFAANSIFCRLALGKSLIDPASFTTIRIGAGTLTLIVLVQISNRHSLSGEHSHWLGAISLFAYAALFSFAYISLTTATGALILFGAVQVTMIGYGIFKGDRPTGSMWIGIGLAVGGLIYLLLPGASAPPLWGAILMIGAGIAWGIYSLIGKGSRFPLQNTRTNFQRSLAITLMLSLILINQIEVSFAGVMLAIASGALASGIGYALWYATLPYLKASQASTIQLSVPLIASAGGIVFMQEPLSFRLIAASAAILGGIALVLHRPAAA